MTSDYIRYRLEVAGTSKELFSPTALSVIHHYSNGIPRLINNICDNALFEGFLQKKDLVSDDIIQEVVSDLKLEGQVMREPMPEEAVVAPPAARADVSPY
ncbi:MAG: hypothetical protein HY201_02170 [Nitrospirae bacterium]|nr:hypothetical protein [Candidatus Troglogloeales bacterium]